MNTIENPATKLREWNKMVQRLASVDSDTTPPKLAIYIGTSGNTQGEANERNPAPKATGNETSVIENNHNKERQF
jgi:hypothetical protein